MQDNIQTDCYTDSKKYDFNESEQYLPTRYDWKQSNCDEKRTVPCKLKEEYVKHKLH